MTWIPGLLLVLTAGADLFLTVLYARISSGLISPRLAKGIWHLFKALAALLPRRRDALLSFAGPVILIATAAVWYCLFIIGFALIFYPHIGTAIKASAEPLTRSFAAALYFSGMSFTTLGTGDIYADTNPLRILTVAVAITGFSTLTLSLTYFLSVYSAIVRRNTFALSLHIKTASTDRAAELLARLGTGDDFADAGTAMSQTAGQLMNLLESHHTYPILHYFRFRKPWYAMSHMLLLILDTLSLALGGLDGQKHHRFLQSTLVTELWEGSLLLLTQLADSFLSPRLVEKHQHPSNREIESWRANYDQALSRLQKEGISTTPDPAAGFDRYAALRRQWHPYIAAFADFTAHS